MPTDRNSIAERSPWLMFTAWVPSRPTAVPAAIPSIAKPMCDTDE